MFSVCLDYYQHQVDRHLISSPFSLAHLQAVPWMATGTRTKSAAHFWVLRLGQSPMDGMPLPVDHKLSFPTGLGEVAHLCYLSALHPLLFAALFTCLLSLSPYFLVCFAVSGFRKTAAQLYDVGSPQLNFLLSRRALILFPVLFVFAVLLIDVDRTSCRWLWNICRWCHGYLSLAGTGALQCNQHLPGSLPVAEC